MTKYRAYKNESGQRFIITAGKGGPRKQDCIASYIRNDKDMHLMASAPELLAALELVKAFLGNPAHKADIPVHETIDAAISKANGTRVRAVKVKVSP